jgi:hypothetical protein
MPSISDFPARGKILSVTDRMVVFAPSNTNYELHLEAAGPLEGVKIGVVLDAIIRATARKIWTVPSGGGFIEPIYGPPRRVQGRVRYLEEGWMVVQAGTPIVVSLPADPEVFDLPNGQLIVGGLVNVSALPGVTIEVLTAVVAK